jgi:hypothetical protein
MKKILSIFFAFICLGPLFSQNGLPKNTKVKLNHTWTKPIAGDMMFYLHSADKKPRSFFLNIKDMYVPVHTATGYSIGTYYALPKSGKLALYSREMKDGLEIFTPVITIDTNGLNDFVVGLFEANGKLGYKVLDLSLEAMPIGSASVVNMHAIPLGISMGKGKGRIGFYNKVTQNSTASGEYGRGYIEVYSLQNPKKPEVLWPGDMRYQADERLILFFFGSKIKASPFPDESDDQINIIANKGPRSSL